MFQGPPPPGGLGCYFKVRGTHSSSHREEYAEDKCSLQGIPEQWPIFHILEQTVSPIGIVLLSTGTSWLNDLKCWRKDFKESHLSSYCSYFCFCLEGLSIHTHGFSKFLSGINYLYPVFYVTLFIYQHNPHIIPYSSSRMDHLQIVLQYWIWILHSGLCYNSLLSILLFSHFPL